MNGFTVTQPVEKVEALFPDVWCCLLNSLGLCVTQHSVSHLQMMMLQRKEEARFGPCSQSLVDKKKVSPGFVQDCRENQCCNRGGQGGSTAEVKA